MRYDQQPCLDAKAAERQVSLDRFCYGIKRFVLGLAKKTIIADQLALIYSRVTSVPAATVPAPALVLGYLAYMMQLYFDFSGYSDMAIGIGSFFGLELPEKLQLPVSVLLGGRILAALAYEPVGLVPGLCVHPAGQPLLAGEKLSQPADRLSAHRPVARRGVAVCGFRSAPRRAAMFERLGLRKFLQCIPPFFAHAYTLVVLWFTLIIFGAHGLAEGLAAWKGILSWQSGAQGYTAAAFADTKLMVLLAASLLLCGPLQACFPRLKKALYAKEAPGLPGMVGLLVLLFLSLMRVTAGTYSAFIYFQF